MKEKLSVVIPIHNGEKYLKECVESVLAQTYDNLEIILINNGSTDRSGAICDEYAITYDNISVLHKSDEGVIKARYEGAKLSTSNYVTFVDADDFIHKEMYQDMMSHMDGCDMVMSQIYRYYDDSNIVAESVLYEEGLYEQEVMKKRIFPHMMYSREINRWGIDPSLCTKIFKKDMLINEMEQVKELGIWYGDDTSVVYPYILSAEKIYILTKPYYYHRQRNRGELPSYVRDDKFFDKLYKVYEYLNKRFKETEYYNVLKPQLEQFFAMSVNIKNNVLSDKKDELGIIFPYEYVTKQSKVVIYGAGKLGKEYIKQNMQYEFCNIVKWVDKRHNYIVFEGLDIDGVEEIYKVDFDYIVIAIDIYEAAVKVREMLISNGISEDKIVWHSIRRRTF